MAADKDKGDKVKLTLVTPTAEGVATLFKKLTGREPDMAKIKARLAKIQGERPAKP